MAWRFVCRYHTNIFSICINFGILVIFNIPQQNKTKTCLTTWHSTRKYLKYWYESQNELQSKSCVKSNGENKMKVPGYLESVWLLTMKDSNYYEKIFYVISWK